MSRVTSGRSTSGGAAGLSGHLTLRNVLWGAVLAGVVLRVVSFWSGYVFWDSPYYIQMGRGLAEGNGLMLPWGDPFSPAGGGFVPGSSHHFSPLYPMYLGAFYRVFGYDLEVTRVAAIILSVLSIVVVYLATRDLMGADKALAVTAVLSLDPALMISTRDLMPEPLIMILFVLTLWAIVKGIQDDRYMVVAALCAAGGYLTKASVGYLFIIAGAGGFAWRFLYLRWDVFRRRYYMAAIVVFLGIVGAWSLRNVHLFGWPNWHTSPYLEDALGTVVRDPWEFLGTLLLTAPFLAALFLTYGAFWLPWVRRSLARVREERTSAMWLAVALVFVITLWFSSALAVYEGSDRLTHTALRLRYIVIAFPPLMWAVMDEVDLGPLKARLDLRGAVGILRGMAGRLQTLGQARGRAVLLAGLLAGGLSLAALDPAYLLVSAALLGGAVSLLLSRARHVLLVMLAVFLLVNLELATERVIVPEVELAGDLDGLIGEGQTVALDGGEVDVGYLYLGIQEFDFNLTVYDVDIATDYIVSRHLDADYPGFSLVKVYDQRHHPGLVKWLSGGLIPDTGPEDGPAIALWERS